MSYTTDETKKEFGKELTKGIKTLYQANCVNWKGETSDTKELYSEVIANELLLNLKEFGKISIVTRSATYSRENHCNINIDLCKSNRNEEIFAKRITGLTLPELGLILDYQIPLKDTLADKGLGKIDLISFNENTKTLFLIELKYEGNDETLLRASLESYTYFKLVDKKKLKNDFFRKEQFSHINLNEIIITPAVLVVPKCNAYRELQEVYSGKRQQFKALSLALGIKFFELEIWVNETEL